MNKEKFWENLDSLLRRRVSKDIEAKDTSIDKAIDDLLLKVEDPEIISYAKDQLINYDIKISGKESPIIVRLAIEHQIKLQKILEKLQFNRAKVVAEQDRQTTEYNETLQNLERVTEDLRGVNLEEPSLEEGDLEAQFDTYHTQLSKAKSVVESTDNLDQLSVIKARVTVIRAAMISFQKAEQTLGNIKKSLSTTIDKIKEKASDILTLISDKVKKISFSEKLLNLTVELSTLKEGSPRYEKIDRAIDTLVDTTDLTQLQAAYELISQKQGHLNFPPKGL